MAKLLPFQKFGAQMSPQFWAGITTENHLGLAFQSQPQRASEMMIQLLSNDRGKSWESFLSQFPVKEFETDDDMFWDVVGSARRNIPLIEARTLDGTVVTEDSPNVGAGTTPFYLVFGEAWFFDGEVINGNLNEVYPIRILEEPKFEGSNAVYKCELMGGNTGGIPAERLLAGERFSYGTAYVERSFSRKVGGVRHASPVSMRNEWSQVRIHHKIGGSMLNKKVAFGIPMVQRTADGKLIRSVDPYWMHYEDYELELTFSEYKNYAYLFGRSNRNANGEYLNIGKSGGVIRTGDGIYAQMAYGNTMYYNSTSGILKLINEALYNLSSDKIPVKERKFAIHTGERGAMAINRDAKRDVSGWTPVWSHSDANPAVIRQNNTAYAPNNGVSVTDFQVTKWIAPMGVEVEIIVDSHYDDTVQNKIMHPEGGPAFSYRFDILSMGSVDEPNIQKCVIKGNPEYRGYQWGMRNPFIGATSNGYMSYDEDAAEVHKMATLGVICFDPTRTMSLIPSVLQG